jgi:hypothetical protein
LEVGRGLRDPFVDGNKRTGALAAAVQIVGTFDTTRHA